MLRMTWEVEIVARPGCDGTSIFHYNNTPVILYECEESPAQAVKTVFVGADSISARTKRCKQ